MEKVRFQAELIEGHKGVTVVLVPFDPEQRWSRKPVRRDPRRHGWLIIGSANGVAFEGYIGQRWNRFFIIIDSGLRKAAKVQSCQGRSWRHAKDDGRTGVESTRTRTSACPIEIDNGAERGPP